MNIQQSYHHNPTDLKFCHVIKSRNDLEISRIDYLKDTQKGQLVIFLESNLLQDLEVNAILQGNNLIIESARSLEYEKPIRTHLIGNETLSEYERGGSVIGFTEVQLKPGFSYGVLSYKMIHPGLLKVILSFQQHKNKLKENVN